MYTLSFCFGDSFLLRYPLVLLRYPFVLGTVPVLAYLYINTKLKHHRSVLLNVTLGTVPAGWFRNNCLTAAPVRGLSRNYCCRLFVCVVFRMKTVNKLYTRRDCPHYVILSFYITLSPHIGDSPCSGTVPACRLRNGLPHGDAATGTVPKLLLSAFGLCGFPDENSQ